MIVPWGLNLGEKPVFLSYVPAGSFSGEGALASRETRNATVNATIPSTGVRLPAQPGAGVVRSWEPCPSDGSPVDGLC